MLLSLPAWLAIGAAIFGFIAAYLQAIETFPKAAERHRKVGIVLFILIGATIASAIPLVGLVLAGESDRLTTLTLSYIAKHDFLLTSPLVQLTSLALTVIVAALFGVAVRGMVTGLRKVSAREAPERSLAVAAMAFAALALFATVAAVVLGDVT